MFINVATSGLISDITGRGAVCNFTAFFLSLPQPYFLIITASVFHVNVVISYC